MSVPNQIPYNIYTANGQTTVFTYEFYIISASDLEVSINGSVVTSGYTISGVGNKDGGDITFLTPPANGSVVMLERVVPTYRLTDYQDNGDLLADTVNKDFDRIWMAIQRAFIDLGLALTRPLFGGPFNAEGYRISNLADPVNDQDAATKKYVIENGKTNLARTLRVPESFVDILPPVNIRKKSLLGWNDMGKPIPVFSMTDTADLAIELGSSTGAALVAINEATLLQLAAPSIYKWMHQSDILTMMTVVGAEVNIDYALQAAIDEGVMSVVMPWGKGVYTASQIVKLPSGFCIFAEGSKRIYVSSVDADFNNAGVVIRKAQGASGIFKMTSRHTFKDIIFDGRDKTVGMINADSQPANLTFINCASYRWLRGFGRTSGYIGTLRGVNCTANNNYDGFFNTIDSWYANCGANANTNYGWNFQTGANNNSLANCRPEWNGKEGIMAYGAKVIAITGDTIDRNGLAGISIKNGSIVLLNGVRFQRNGAVAAAGSSDNCHILMEGEGSTLIASGLSTVAGVDDDGQGNLSPQYGLVTTGGSANMKIIIGDSDMSGATVSVTRSIVTASVRKYRNNIGLSDVSTEGLTQIRDGVPCIGDPVIKANLPARGTLNFTLKLLNVGMGTYSEPLTRTIEFQSRNESQNAGESYFLKVRISRLTTTDAVISPLGPDVGSASNWGMIDASPSAVGIAISVSADGTTINGTLTGIDNGARYVSIFLRP
ncbi:phage tail fiber protein [Klebsiella aerogenes]|uniref:phage tail fiber domain-containing protein n=1 Tax=Klebsiella aerogenes TaxID=548 RepID=UPI00378DD549